MRNSKSTLGMLAAAGILAAGAGMPAARADLGPEARVAQVSPAKSGHGFGLHRLLNALRGLDGGRGRSTGVGGYPSRAGWTNARYQRHARKLRNRARHRRACRG